LYGRLCPNAKRWADYLRLHGGFESIGENCEINRDASISDPYLVRLGNDVTLSSCSLIGHDGSIKQIYKATGLKVDAVGKIDIKDNCFIGYRATILRNVTIGPNSIVAAGAVVTKSVPPNSVAAGVPARVIGTIGAVAEKLVEETSQLPWCDIIANRDGAFDAKVEPQLRTMRRRFFWES
jgi:acetyltransferase-like isoleucine patch superfamily enzyme